LVAAVISAEHLDRRQREREITGLSLPALLLRTGAMAGPYRACRPATISALKRILRAARAIVISNRSPL
jgi:hypothetical protein